MIEKTRLGSTSALRRLAALAVGALALVAPPAATAAEPVALSVGHTDAVAPTYEAGALVMKVKDDTGSAGAVFRNPSDVVFHAKVPESEIEVPDNPSFAFLGEPGSRVWLLPMTQDQQLLWPGFSSEQIAPGVLEGNALSWRLTGVDGPGEMFLFETGSFGQVVMSFRSDQALPQSKPMAVGVHAHYNWAFTAQGRYTLTFEVTGTQAGGGPLTTGEVDYTFVVGGFGDLGVELAIDGVRERYAPGDTVKLEAAQRPRTVLDHYHWFRRCDAGAEWSVISGAFGGEHSFTAQAADEDCELKAALYDHDHVKIAESYPVELHVHEHVDPDPDPGPKPTPDPGGNDPADPPATPNDPVLKPPRPALRLLAASLRKRTVRVQLHSSRRARATIKILRKRRVVARSKARTVPKGAHTLRFTLDRRLKPGGYRVRVRLVAGDRATVRTIVLRVPERR